MRFTECRMATRPSNETRNRCVQTTPAVTCCGIGFEARVCFSNLTLNLRFFPRLFD
jgi:hypothetical protein